MYKKLNNKQWMHYEIELQNIIKQRHMEYTILLLLLRRFKNSASKLLLTEILL